MMKSPLHPHFHHQSPDWVRDPVYFITICTEKRGQDQLCHELGEPIINSVAAYQDNHRWHCHVALLMPDHVHFLLSFNNQITYSKIIGDWKRWNHRHQGIIWQENFFEHRLRDDQSFGEKADYILHNPVRAGLVRAWREWPFLFMAT